MIDELKLFKALSDETRLKIVEFLLDGEKCVCETYPHVKRTQSTVSIQLHKLQNLGILKSRRESKKVFYSIKDHRVCEIFKLLGNQKVIDLKDTCCITPNECNA